MPDQPLHLQDHDARLLAARRRAAWELGDPSWADVLIRAYLDPTTDQDDLREDMQADPEQMPV